MDMGTMEDMVVAGGALAGVLVIVFFLWLWEGANKVAREREQEEERARREARYEMVDRLIAPHLKALAIKRSQLVTKDAYGTVLIDAWTREVDYFFDTVLRREFVLVDGDLALIKQRIEDRAVEYADREGLSVDGWSVFGKSGVEYELSCERLLQDAGWTTRHTGASGDQGVDIIGERDGVRLVVQCKNFSTPVGNAAVQEIHAGRAFENADVAVVVSPVPYTRAAKELAQKTGVMLLHHSELKNLWSLTSSGSSNS